MEKRRSRSSSKALIYLIFLLSIANCKGHGRLIEPPSRASAWRYGFQTPADYNDHELYCGGFTRQWKRNGGKCGVCGDAWDLPEPRPHEYGGQWGQGIIVRKYLPQSEILIRVELTASHMGFFEFRLCSNPNATQDCLDKNLLKILSGSPLQSMPSDINTRFYPRNGSRVYEIKAQLPDIKCNECVLQWRYIAGNNWGICPDGNGAVGCGPQEEFRSCADIALGEGAHTPFHPMLSPSKTTVHPRKPSKTTESPNKQSSEESNTLWTILLVLFFVVLTCFASVWFVKSYYKETMQEVLHIKSNSCWHKLKKVFRTKKLMKSTSSALEVPFSSKEFENNNAFEKSLGAPPVPPPRNRRNSKVEGIEVK